MSKKWCGIFFTFIVIGLSLFGHNVRASDELHLDLGLSHSTYNDEAGSEISYHLKLRHDDYPVYLFAGYENPDVKMLGQPLGDASILSVGLGVRQTFSKLTVFAEAGYGHIDLSINQEIQEEIVYTKLVIDHHSQHRSVPVNPRDYEHSYEMSDSVLGRVGLSYEVADYLNVTFSYRWMMTKVEYAICDEERRRTNQGYWRKDSTHDLSALEIGLFFTF